MDKNELLKSLPKVDTILSRDEIKSLSGIPYSIIIESVRDEINSIRKLILADEIININIENITNKVLARINKKNSMHLKRVINATGIVLHTNLGRSCIPRKSVEAVINVASNYSNLEFDIEIGARGSRYSHVEDILCKITGAEAALVVNNNAAAVMLALSTLAKGKEAIVSRGQLVEIGGSFRVPAVMEESGASLVEVGTTNRTHLYDYENAIGEDTGVILRVHQSNYKILGFTEDVPLEELVELGNKNEIPVIEDIGSGVFVDFSKYGLTHEPTVQESIKNGIDIVTFSGDKMLGGPQAGIIVGKKKYVDMMKKNQLTRALRIDKMTLAALEAVIRLYLDEETAIKEIPVLNMLTKSQSEIKASAGKLARILKTKLKDRGEIKVEEDFSQVGGGSMPLENLKTYVVSIKPQYKKVEDIEYSLRTSEIPIIARINRDRIIFDVRTIFKEDYNVILKTLDSLL